MTGRLVVDNSRSGPPLLWSARWSWSNSHRGVTHLAKLWGSVGGYANIGRKSMYVSSTCILYDFTLLVNMLFIRKNVGKPVLGISCMMHAMFVCVCWLHAFCTALHIGKKIRVFPKMWVFLPPTSGLFLSNLDVLLRQLWIHPYESDGSPSAHGSELHEGKCSDLVFSRSHFHTRSPRKKGSDPHAFYFAKVIPTMVGSYTSLMLKGLRSHPHGTLSRHSEALVVVWSCYLKEQ